MPCKLLNNFDARARDKKNIVFFDFNRNLINEK